MRERSNSLPIVDLFKRAEKRKERQGEGEGAERTEALKKSTKVVRSPGLREGGGKELLEK